MLMMEKYIKKQWEKDFAPLDDDDDGAIAHCSIANGLQIPEQLTANKNIEQIRTHSGGKVCYNIGNVA